MLGLEASLFWLRQIFWKVVPEQLFQPGMFLAAPEVIRVAQLPLRLTDEREVARLKRQARPIQIVLDQELALKRDVTVPRAAAAVAEQAIALQMRQTMPAQARGLIWCSQPVAARDKLGVHRVFVLKEAQLQQVAETVRDHGLQLHSVRIAGTDAPPLATGKAFRTSLRDRWLGIAAVAVVGVSIWQVTSLEIATYRLNQSNAERADQLEQAEAGLIQAKEEAGKAEGEHQMLAEDIALFNAQSRPLDLLADLTRTLPDTVWVSELSLRDAQIALSGFAASDIAELVKGVRTLPWAASAQLQGPAVVDSYSQQIRFDMSISLSNASAPP